MQQTFPKTWVSSIDHMNFFSTIASKNSWWKFLLALNKIPNEFPQLKMGLRKYPLVFFSEGALTLFERELEFKGRKAFPPNGKYNNLKDDFRFEISYNSMAVYLHPNPFMKTFNILWIKLSVTDNNSAYHFLVSAGGQSIKQVSNTNEEIFQILKDKASFVSMERSAP